MRITADTYLSQVNKLRTVGGYFRKASSVLCLAVILCVFWGLKLTGITMAGEAFCGIAEHAHTEACILQTTICDQEESDSHTHTDACYQSLIQCTLEEHVHAAICYSDITADLENDADWEADLKGLNPAPGLAEKIVQVARSQLGMSESIRNFQVDGNQVRRGITRYGQWYGSPYGDWSAMFASFCLHYAGAVDVPEGAGPETLRLEWEALGLYKAADGSDPIAGWLLFLDQDQDGSADAVAIVSGVEEDRILAIQGDVPQTPADPVLTAEVEPNGEQTDAPDHGDQEEADSGEELSQMPVDVVAEMTYDLSDPAVLGWGLTTGSDEIMPLAPGDARYIWLDGTNGGIMSLNGSPNERWTTFNGQTIREGNTITLPASWASPAKYSYVLRGWYDVTNSRYYAPGAEVKVTGNMVFYADWAAETYDVGQFNAQVANTVSTSDFVTVRMFDYGVLFNVLSETASISTSNNSHTETWSLLTTGNNPYNGEQTLNYIFRDWDRGSEDISYPVNTNDRNNPTSAGTVFSGLYTAKLGSLLFDPNVQVIGKQYLGEADHLFQLCLDPNHEHYGYFYYNSERNAASYNQSAQRFYVYEYLECTRTSANSGDEGKYSDFLPLNSPYAKTNGKQVNTYNYAGVENEYNGTTHYMYDCRYNDNGNSTNYVGTNFFFGMSVEVEFYLPNEMGTGGNKDIYGSDMHFRFTGDDDVWIFVDGVMVLDLGGLHGRETGDINFSTGQVTINNVVNTQLSNALQTITAGEHKLTLYYLERGSSMSNCAIYFNLAPRFSFSIQKEDVLTRDVLNGAQFSVFTDAACTKPAELWTSKAAHDARESATNVFTVVDGVAHMWGMGAGNTYYIKETRPPDNSNYGFSYGVICLTFDYKGTASYNVEIRDEGNAGVSNGFTVHGFRIDAETQQAYIVATNAPTWVTETTSVHVRKVWQDNVDHSGEEITVYLTTTDPDGTVRRLQEARLGSENGWYHCWENLPKYRQDGVTPVVYGVEEAYIPGYNSKVELVENYNFTTTQWVKGNTFEDGTTYLLGSGDRYLSTRDSGSDTGYMWVDATTAQASNLALWTAAVNGQKVKLTNGAGQTITFYYNGGSATDFFASTGGESNAAKQNLNFVSIDGGLRLYYDGENGSDYYLIASMTNANKFQYSNNASDALVFTPEHKVETTVAEKVNGWAYLVTNISLEQETALTVEKLWDYGDLDPGDIHKEYQVTVKLLANGKDTGRTVTLSLKNGWKDTFRGLPYVDENGNVITYTVQESWNNTEWIAEYGPVVVSGGNPPTYSTTITNNYRWGMGGLELPTTGTAARMLFILCGGSIMLFSLVYGIILRRKRERRMGTAF